MPGGEPATMITLSPSTTRPAASSTSSTCIAISSVCRASPTRKVSTPQVSASWLRVHWLGVKASIGMRGRTRDSRRVESPLVVKVMRYLQPSSSPISAAAAVTAPPLELGRVPSGRMRCSPWSSVFSMMRAMVRTAANACLPTLVSPESIRASAPSSTALAASEASARVGRLFSIIDSSTWVATMTGLARRRAISHARFCTSGTSSSGISTPRSPRATITPSKARMISSRFSTACGFSILAMTGSRSPSSSMIACTSRMSSAVRTNDSAIMSTRIRSAQRRSALSFSDIAGTDTATPGRLMPLLFDSVPPSSTWHTTSVSVTDVAISAILPSSMRMRSPALTSPGRPS